MHWTVEGAADIIALRCLQASDRWEQNFPPASQHPEPAWPPPAQPEAMPRSGYWPVTYIHVSHPPSNAVPKNVST